MLDKYSSRIQSFTNDIEKVDYLISSSNEVKQEDIKYAFALSQEAERLARSCNYQKGLADSLYEQGKLYYLEFDYELALINLIEALRLYQEIDDKPAGLLALDNIGNIYFDLTGYDYALRNYLESLKIREELNDEAGKVTSLNNIAKVYEKLGYFDQALSYYLKSLIINEHLHDQIGQIHSLVSIGRIYELLKDYEHGITYYERASEAAKKTSDSALIADILTRIGEAYNMLSQYEIALDYHEKSLSLRIDAQDRPGEAISLNHIGKIHESLDNYLRALTFYFKSWQLFENQKDKPGEARTLLGIGNMFIKRQEGYKAPKYLFKVLSIAESLKSNDMINQTYKALSLSYKQMSEFENALNYHEKFHEYEKRYLNDQAKEKAKSLVIQFEVEKTQKEAEIYQLKNVELEKAKEELQVMNQSLAEANEVKTNLVEELDKLSREDALTKLFNRRHFDQKFSEEIIRCQRYKHPLPVAISDIDLFKNINDTYSHQIGDQVLIEIAKIFKSTTRKSDVVARYGGEEFVMLFPETSYKNAVVVCNKIRKTIEEHNWEKIAKGLKVTISMGMCEMNDDHLDPEEIMKIADENLYKAKENGRNQVVT